MRPVDQASHFAIEHLQESLHLVAIGGWGFDERSPLIDIAVIIEDRDGHLHERTAVSHLLRDDVYHHVGGMNSRPSSFVFSSNEPQFRSIVGLRFRFDHGVLTFDRDDILDRFAMRHAHGVTWESDFFRLAQLNVVAVDRLAANARLTKPLPERTNGLDIVIPVYNGIEHLAPLVASLVPQLRKTDTVIVVDDASPDTRVARFLYEDGLDGVRDRAGSVHLIRNSANLGYLDAVNVGLGYTRQNVVLLNTDVRLSKNALAKIAAAFQLDPSIGTVTPVTNAATIFSFPNFAQDHQLLDHIDVDQMDACFDRNEPCLYGYPTGVGYCFGIARACLDRCGGFDRIFTRGYGEENDFCMRIKAGGFKNIALANCFVYHKHGGSFTSEEKRLLNARNDKIMRARWPTYFDDVARAARLDPLLPGKTQACFAMMSRFCDRLTIVFDHAVGGGTNAFSTGFVSRLVAQEASAVLLVQNEGHSDYMICTARIGLYEVRFVVPTISHIAHLIDIAALDVDIVVNSLVTFRRVHRTVDQILALRRSTLTLFFHDYFMVCPSYTLLHAKGRFCGIPDPQVCDHCLPVNSFAEESAEETDIRRWRESFDTLIRAADEVTCFSQSSARLLVKAFPSAATIVTVKPHASLGALKSVATWRHGRRASGSIRIAVFGNIQFQKGRSVLERLSAHIEMAELPLEIHVFGELLPPLKARAIRAHGPYERKDMPDLVKREEIDIILLPSVWPETFSYVAQEAMEMEMPFCCFDLGAPAERTRRYPLGLVLETFAPSTIASQITTHVTSLRAAAARPAEHAPTDRGRAAQAMLG